MHRRRVEDVPHEPSHPAIRRVGCHGDPRSSEQVEDIACIGLAVDQEETSPRRYTIHQHADLVLASDVVRGERAEIHHHPSIPFDESVECEPPDLVGAEHRVDRPPEQDSTAPEPSDPRHDGLFVLLDATVSSPEEYRGHGCQIGDQVTPTAEHLDGAVVHSNGVDQAVVGGDREDPEEEDRTACRRADAVAPESRADST